MNQNNFKKWNLCSGILMSSIWKGITRHHLTTELKIIGDYTNMRISHKDPKIQIRKMIDSPWNEVHGHQGLHALVHLEIDEGAGWRRPLLTHVRNSAVIVLVVSALWSLTDKRKGIDEFKKNMVTSHLLLLPRNPEKTKPDSDSPNELCTSG